MEVESQWLASWMRRNKVEEIKTSFCSLVGGSRHTNGVVVNELLDLLASHGDVF